MSSAQMVPPPAPPLRDRRGWLIAFGIFEILIACFFLLLAVMMIVLIPAMPMPSGQPQLPRAFFAAIGVFYAAIAAVFLTTGIGSILARNWARITMIVISSLWLVFGFLGTLFSALLMPAILRQQHDIVPQGDAALPEGFATTVMIISVAFQVILGILLPLVFLLFYASKSVKATCQVRDQAVAAAAALPLPASAIPAGLPATSAARRFPVPVVILVIWYGFSSISALMAAAWIPMAVIFGSVVRGAAGRIVMLAFGLAAAYCAWGLARLRIEGWWTSLIFSAFWTVSGLVTALRLDMSAYIGEVYREMGMISPPVDIFSVTSGFMRITTILGMLFAVAFLALLLYSKRYFPAREQGVSS